MHTVDRATQPLDYARMFAAWRWLRLHHSVLRTTFVALDAGVTYQVVLKDVPENDPTFLYVELDGPFEEAVKTVLHAEAAKPSDMFTPPVRARHIRVGEQDAFVLIIHHSLYGTKYALKRVDQAAHHLFRCLVAPFTL
jgi:ferricrocin synthase